MKIEYVKRAGYFLTGYALNAIMWRVDQQRLDDVHFPLLIMACGVGIIAMFVQPDTK